MQAGHRFCKNSEQIGDQSCGWSTRAVTYSFEAYLQQLGIDRERQLVGEAVAMIMAVCGISITEAPRGAGMVLLNAARGPRKDLDGPGGTLAYCGMPCSPLTKSVLMVMDLDETWLAGEGQTARGGVQFKLVFIHEFLHGLGIPHCETGEPAIMRPFYDPNQTELAAWDIAELVKRYGPPAKPASPVVPAIPADSLTIDALRVLAGEKRYKLVPE